MGARAAWADFSLRTGLLLVKLARPGEAQDARVSALRNLGRPQALQRRSREIEQVYDRVIGDALHDRDVRVVVAGLSAYEMLHQEAGSSPMYAIATRWFAPEFSAR